MNINNYSDEWAGDIADLFYASVHAIDPAVYTQAQKDAWAPAPVDYERWSARLAEKQPFVALMEGRVAGFIELDPDGHIDCLYTHPDYQGRGVASSLYEYLLAEAKQAGITRLYVEASLVARPFFEHRGFAVIKENRVYRNGVALVNFSMEKQLGPEA